MYSSAIQVSTFVLLLISAVNSNGLDLYHAEYHYDARGLVTNLVERYEGGPAESRSLSYDAQGRLILEKVGAHPVQYQYDKLGNRLSQTHPVEQTFQYNTRNELLQQNVSGDPRELFYDLNGSLTQKVSGAVAMQYTWDSRGRLRQVSTNGVNVFRADYAEGLNRQRKTEGTITKVFRHDGATAIQEVNDSGKVKELIRGDRGASTVGGVLYSADEEGTNTYTYNGVGSTVVLSEDDGTTRSIKYDAFGNILEADQGVDTERLANTKELDQSIGLYFHGARYYDATIGRYISRDPARDGINHYIYANNAPLSFVDPTGLSSEPKGIAGFYANYFNFQYIWDSNRTLGQWTPPGDIIYSSADIGSAFYEGQNGMGLAMIVMAFLPGKVAEHIPDAGRLFSRLFKGKGGNPSIDDGMPPNGGSSAERRSIPKGHEGVPPLPGYANTTPVEKDLSSLRAKVLDGTISSLMGKGGYGEVYDLSDDLVLKFFYSPEHIAARTFRDPTNERLLKTIEARFNNNVFGPSVMHGKIPGVHFPEVYEFDRNSRILLARKIDDMTPLTSIRDPALVKIYQERYQELLDIEYQQPLERMFYETFSEAYPGILQARVDSGIHNWGMDKAGRLFQFDL